MKMTPESLAESIQNGTVSASEMQSFVKHVVSISERWNDSAVEQALKEIYNHGLNPVATAALTDSMRNSGRCLEWPKEWKHLVVDKHSTGGVGDKVSIPLAPSLIHI